MVEEADYKTWVASLSPSDQRRCKLYEQWGYDAVKSDLDSGTYKLVGGTLQVQALAHLWLHKAHEGNKPA